MLSGPHGDQNSISALTVKKRMIENGQELILIEHEQETAKSLSKDFYCVSP